jgi:large subunit ribosomal protein L10
VLRSKLLGVIMAPATQLAATINTPGTQLARVISARAAKGE